MRRPEAASEAPEDSRSLRAILVAADNMQLALLDQGPIEISMVNDTMRTESEVRHGALDDTRSDHTESCAVGQPKINRIHAR
jgi:hypothetical protein